MEANVIQFIPRPNPERDARALELRNVAIVAAASDLACRQFVANVDCVPDDPSEYAMDDDTAPAEYIAPDQDSA